MKYATNKEKLAVFKFGKYKGAPINQIIDICPEYVYWCLCNIDGFKLSLSQKSRLDFKLNEREDYDYVVKPHDHNALDACEYYPDDYDYDNDYEF